MSPLWKNILHFPSTLGQFSLFRTWGVVTKNHRDNKRISKILRSSCGNLWVSVLYTSGIIVCNGLSTVNNYALWKKLCCMLSLWLLFFYPSFLSENACAICPVLQKFQKIFAMVLCWSMLEADTFLNYVAFLRS